MDGLYEQFRIILHQLWQRRWLAMAVAWCVALAGWLVIAVIPNSYEAKGRLFIHTDTMMPSAAGATVADRQNDLLRLKQTLTSNENLTRVVRRTDLNSLVRTEAELGGIITGLRERIKIVAQPDSIVEITATSNLRSFSNAQNARAAAAVVQQLVELFTGGGTGNDPREAGQSTVLDEELRRRELQLQEAEQRRVEFEQRFMGMLPGAGSIGDRMGTARTELGQLEQTIVAAQTALNAMSGQLASMPATIPIAGADMSVAAGPATAQIGALQTQLSQYQGRGFTEQHPDVISIRAQIGRLRPQAASERSGGRAAPAGIPNPSHTSLRAMMSEREAQLAAARTRRGQLQADLGQLGQRQSSEPGVAAEQQRLARDHDVLRRQYDQLLADREQLRLRTDIQARTSGMNVRVVQPPSVPSAPAFPNRPLFLSLVLVAAIGAGIAAAFFKGQLQTTFPTQNRLAEATGLPVLGSVSEVPTRGERGRRRQRLMWLAGSGGALAASYAVLMAVEFAQRSALA